MEKRGENERVKMKEAVEEIEKGERKEQGRIHGNPVADGWAGAVMRKTLGIEKWAAPPALPTSRHTDLPTYRPTDRHGKV